MAKVVQELLQAGKNVSNGDPVRIIVLLTEMVWFIIDVTHSTVFGHRILII